VRVGDFRRTDRVLDAGCAYGEVAVDVAAFVGHVHGLDISPERVVGAARRAANRGVRNATFEAVPIQDYPLEPFSWDVSLFLRAWGKGARTRMLGGPDLSRVLRATRRQTILQVGVRRNPDRLSKVLEICQANGFDALCFARPHLIVANRWGSDARIRELPKQVLVATEDGLVRLPTASFGDHPIVRSSRPRAA